MVVQLVDEIGFDLTDLPAMPAPGRVLLTTPDHFEVAYVINPHMKGNLGSVDGRKARRQWEALREAYEALSIETAILQGASGYPDMVFCANQTLPYLLPDAGERGVVLSNMFAAPRRGEVAFLAGFFEREGYRIQTIENSSESFFEGMGDAIWHPGRCLLWGGHGYRTDARVYERIAVFLEAPIVRLELTDPDFYHLDTCLCVLDSTSVLIYPGAFRPEGLATIHRLFDRVLRAPEYEARTLFACNAHCPDQQHVFIQRGCKETTALLRNAGFEPIELETGEFLKSGGSVFCMKQMYW
jgi:N-dimethylarginine dimethylaminohydrolase